MKMNKFIALVLFLSALEFCICDDNKEFETLWEECFEKFKNTKFNLTKDEAEKNFLKIHDDIIDHNEKHDQNETTYRKSHNCLSLLSDEDRKNLLNNMIPNLNSKYEDNTFSKRHLVAIPNTCNWTNIMNPIEYQQNCGDCYAFAAAATIEAMVAVKLNKSVVLSKQQITDCSTGSPYNNGGCNGGYPAEALHYAYDYGLQLQSKYPFTGSLGTCKYNGVASSSNPIYYATGWSYSSGAGAANARNRVYTLGPQYACIDAQNDFLNYGSGIFTSSSCNCNGQTTHVITIVGYVLTSSISTSYWIIRNSWGNLWGMNGYGYIQMGSNMCSIEQYVGSPTGVSSNP